MSDPNTIIHFQLDGSGYGSTWVHWTRPRPGMLPVDLPLSHDYVYRFVDFGGSGL